MTSNTITVDVVNSSTSTNMLLVTPASVTATLGAQVTLTAVYIRRNGKGVSVTNGVWTVTGPANLTATSSGVTLMAATGTGTANVTCQATENGKTLQAQSTVTIVDPTRIVGVAPSGSPAGARLEATVQIAGNQYTGSNWSVY